VLAISLSTLLEKTLKVTATSLDLPAKTWDVAVAGGGPAGTMAALQLAERGHSVLLVDRASFPRAKVCGCCLNQLALSLLKRVRGDRILEEARAPLLRKLDLHISGRVSVIPLPGYRSISRQRLDSELTEMARERGVHFLSGLHAALGSTAGDRWQILLRCGGFRRSVFARVVICSDGLNGDFLAGRPELAPKIADNSRIGLGTVCPGSAFRLPKNLIQMAVGDKGYVGAVRLEDGSTNIAAAVDKGALKATGTSPASVVQEILLQAGARELPELESQRWKGTAPLTRARPVLGDDRLFILGDAAGYTEPFTGEGIAWALASGYLVAPLASEAVSKWHPGLLREWQRIYRKQIRRRQLTCRLVQVFLRSPGLSRLPFITPVDPVSLVGPVISLMNRPLLRRC
jgi:flavin-dependent dehydrogenase